MRVAVLRGGPSLRYEESLATGEHVLNVLREGHRYKPLDIFISKDGVWHRDGMPVSPEKVLQNTDVAFNALHGAYGEDGGVQKILITHGIPYTGSDAIASALSNHHHFSREKLADAGLNMSRYVVLSSNATLEEVTDIFRSFMHPIVVMPIKDHTSFGKKIVNGFQDLLQSIADAFRHSSQVLVEEGVRGKDVYCGVLENMRGEKIYAMLPVPNLKSAEVNREVESAARKAHEALGLRHYSLSHLVVTPQGKVYFSGARSHPSLHNDSPFSESLHSVGITNRQCIEHLINLTLEK